MQSMVDEGSLGDKTEDANARSHTLCLGCHMRLLGVEAVPCRPRVNRAWDAGDSATPVRSRMFLPITPHLLVMILLVRNAVRLDAAGRLHLTCLELSASRR